jgi:hypothetical protein
MRTEVEVRLERLFAEILREIRENSEFAERVGSAFTLTSTATEESGVDSRDESRHARGRRRAPAAIDPLALFGAGEPALRRSLGGLDIEELKDIVAEHGMDTNKLAMKWKSRARLEDLIVTSIRDRLEKGDPFRRRGGNPRQQKLD